MKGSMRGHLFLLVAVCALAHMATGRGLSQVSPSPSVTVAEQTAALREALLNSIGNVSASSLYVSFAYAVQENLTSVADEVYYQAIALGYGSPVVLTTEGAVRLAASENGTTIANAMLTSYAQGLAYAIPRNPASSAVAVATSFAGGYTPSINAAALALQTEAAAGECEAVELTVVNATRDALAAGYALAFAEGVEEAVSSNDVECLTNAYSLAVQVSEEYADYSPSPSPTSSVVAEFSSPSPSASLTIDTSASPSPVASVVTQFSSPSVSYTSSMPASPPPPLTPEEAGAYMSRLG